MEDFAEQNKTIVCEPDSPSGYDVLGVKIVDTFLRMDPPDPEAEGPQIRGHYRIDVEYDTKVRFVMLLMHIASRERWHSDFRSSLRLCLYLWLIYILKAKKS